jgi:glycosyltransferase involved in cell wall biosynthesis
VAVIADLREALGPGARSEVAALTFELVDALAQCVRDVGELTADLFARRGSCRSLPLVSLEPEELGWRAEDPLDAVAAADALACQVALAGLFEGYHLVHCLAPLTNALQLIGAAGVPILQTIVTEPEHASARFPPLLVPKGRLRQVATTPRAASADRPLVGTAVDLTRFAPVGQAEDRFLLYAGDDAGLEEAQAVATLAGRPLLTLADGEPVWLLQHARALLYLLDGPPASGPVWPLRALACGTPVAAWRNTGLDAVLESPAMGTLATRGDRAGLARGILELSARDLVAAERRELCLARYNRRAMLARYRELYREMATVPARPGP